jgi:hypothetical protein
MQQEIDPFLLQLSKVFELSPSDEKRLISYWNQVLKPHTSDIFRFFEVNWKVIRAFLESEKNWRQGGNRLRISQHLLFQMATEAFKAESQLSSQKRSSLFGAEMSSPRQLETKGLLVSLKDGFKDKQDAETAFLLRTISDVLKSTAEELALSNEKIERILSSMEEKVQAKKTNLTEEIDRRAGGSL